MKCFRFPCGEGFLLVNTSITTKMCIWLRWFFEVWPFRSIETVCQGDMVSLSLSGRTGSTAPGLIAAETRHPLIYDLTSGYMICWPRKSVWFLFDLDDRLCSEAGGAPSVILLAIRTEEAVSSLLSYTTRNYFVPQSNYRTRLRFLQHTPCQVVCCNKRAVVAIYAVSGRHNAGCPRRVCGCMWWQQSVVVRLFHEGFFQFPGQDVRKLFVKVEVL